MPKQTDHLKTTWNIDTSDDVWTLTTKATIFVTGEDGIYAGKDFTGNKINVYGDILVTESGAAVHVESKYNTINIGESANINALDTNTAIQIDAGRNVIHNDGYIIAKTAAIGADVDTEIVNTGKITGGSAVFAELGGLKIDNSGEMSGGNFAIRAHSDGAHIVNQETGLIKADNFSIVLDNADDVVIKNFGKMVGAINALGDGETSVVNRGFINGDIDLAGGNDKFDTRGGIVNGEVDGGDGADLYLVSNSKANIVEAADHGLDTVKSTADFKLAVNFENLTLIGGKDIDGTGNGGSNVLYGNKGDNVLSGKGGDDSIISGSGNDLMLGGKGDDIFDFAKHAGHDVIGDFQDGHDLIRADFVGNEVEFDDMMAHHLTVKGDDLLIHYGNDTLLIKGMEKSDLDMSDFFTGL
jgi:Ca2+-binding RTX toxin-like protein